MRRFPGQVVQGSREDERPGDGIGLRIQDQALDRPAALHAEHYELLARMLQDFDLRCDRQHVIRLDLWPRRFLATSADQIEERTPSARRGRAEEPRTRRHLVERERAVVCGSRFAARAVAQELARETAQL